MKQWKTWFRKIRNNRKFRCGGFSAALTAAVILCVLLLGALADRLESRYALQADFSFNGVTSQGDEEHTCETWVTVTVTDAP